MWPFFRHLKQRGAQSPPSSFSTSYSLYRQKSFIRTNHTIPFPNSHSIISPHYFPPPLSFSSFQSSSYSTRATSHSHDSHSSSSSQNTGNNSRNEHLKIIYNDMIDFDVVRVFDETTGHIGDMSGAEANEMARERQTDLVLINMKKIPPWCKLMPVRQFAEEMKRMREKGERERGENGEERRGEKKNEIKQQVLSQYQFDPAKKEKIVHFSAIEQDHDLNRKLGKMREYLSKGHRIIMEMEKRTASPSQMAERAVRIVSEVKDLCKPVSFPTKIEAFHRSTLSLKLWPCSPQQAATFKLPQIAMESPLEDPDHSSRKDEEIRLRKVKGYRR